MTTLHGYQSEIIDRARERLTTGGRRRIIVVIPTGGGKTIIAARVVLNAIAKNCTALFLVHRRELLKQAAQKLTAETIDAGIISPGFRPRPDQAVQVASISTLHARAIRSNRMSLPDADLVVVDECHHATAATWRTLLDRYPLAYVVGLTATPCRGDGRGLGGIFEEIVEGPDVAELVRLGHLVGTRVYAAPPPDLSGVKMLAGDYNEKQLAEKVNTVELVGDVVTHWLRFARGRRTIVYAVDVAHSVHLRDEFCRAGVAAGHIDGSTPIDERDAILKQFADGVLDVVCNCAILTEGFDCPEAACIVLARPTKSFGLYRQMVGRGLRPAEGKTECVVIDHAGITADHGFVEEPVQWTLAPDRKAHAKKANGSSGHVERKLKDCPECGAARWQGKPCPACGWRGHKNGAGVDFVDGELVELARDGQARAEAGIKPEEFYRRLLWIAGERGRNPGWAAHSFREKFKAWPKRKWQNALPLEPDAITRSWVRSRDIAFARSRDRRDGNNAGTGARTVA